MKLCKFCGGTFEKLSDSHIFPRAFFEYTRKIAGLNKQQAMLMVTNYKGQFPNGKLWIGWYDPNLLCANCEKIFSQYDEYASELLLQRENEHKLLIKQGHEVAWLVDNFDFNKLKLFLISILWRAGASSLKQFHRIDPGEDLDVMKSLIKAGNSDNDNYFDFILGRDASEEGKSIFLDPHVEKNDFFGDVRVFCFYIGGGYVAYVKADKKPFFPGSRILSPVNGKQLIILKRDFMKGREWKLMLTVYNEAEDIKAKFRNK